MREVLHEHAQLEGVTLGVFGVNPGGTVGLLYHWSLEGLVLDLLRVVLTLDEGLLVSDVNELLVRLSLGVVD